MQVLMIDGHPDAPRLSSHLLDIYRQALPAEAKVTQMALNELDFECLAMHDYANSKPWEPDLRALAEALDACDHVVIAFPMWWGGEPALVKDVIERVLLPHFAFRWHDDGPWWDRLLAGRSADVIATMDTPPLYLRFGYGDAIVKRWRRQVLGFCGFKPVRFLRLGVVREGGAEKSLPKWRARIERMARSIRQAEPDKKQNRFEAFVSYRGDNY